MVIGNSNDEAYGVDVVSTGLCDATAVRRVTRLRMNRAVTLGCTIELSNIIIYLKYGNAHRPSNDAYRNSYAYSRHAAIYRSR